MKPVVALNVLNISHVQQNVERVEKVPLKVSHCTEKRTDASGILKHYTYNNHRVKKKRAKKARSIASPNMI